MTSKYFLKAYHLTIRSSFHKGNALKWPIITKYQPLPSYTGPVPSITNCYRLILTYYHHVPTIAALHTLTQYTASSPRNVYSLANLIHFLCFFVYVHTLLPSLKWAATPKIVECCSCFLWNSWRSVYHIFEEFDQVCEMSKFVAQRGLYLLRGRPDCQDCSINPYSLLSRLALLILIFVFVT